MDCEDAKSSKKCERREKEREREKTKQKINIVDREICECSVPRVERREKWISGSCERAKRLRESLKKLVIGVCAILATKLAKEGKSSENSWSWN